jgi:hypothetical protein
MKLAHVFSPRLERQLPYGARTGQFRKMHAAKCFAVASCFSPFARAATFFYHIRANLHALQCKTCSASPFFSMAR